MQHPPACGELLLGEQARLDPLGQLDLLPGVEQRHLPDLLEVVLNRVGRSPGRCHPGGGQVLVVIAETQQLVRALLAGLRRAAGSSRDAALAGAWPLLTSRLLRGAALTVGRAWARRFGWDLNSAAVPAGVCRVIQAQRSADTTTGGCGELWLMGQPRSSCTRRGFGGAAR
jgi:hypothetical protein